MSVKSAKISFQDLLQRLTSYWASRGCVLHQGHDVEVGAGTSNPATFLRSLGPEPYNAVYIEPSRRPRDGRYGQNPNRMQCFHQGQVILKPSPPNCQDLYLESLAAMGLDLSKHDIRFVHDDWENPSLGASGLGWEVWCDGMEISQFTYFQTVGGIPVDAVTCEITYGLERLAMYLNDVNNVYDLPWNDTLSYGDVRHEDEVEWSAYNFEHSSAEMWARHFGDYESEAKRILEAKLPIPAYDFVIKASHAFNMLDARGAVSVSERASYIGRIRNLAKLAAEGYIEERKAKGFPLLKKEQAPVSPTLNQPKDIPTSGSAPFLLEIGCEELPASFVEPALAQLGANLRSLLQKQGIPFAGLSTLATPRRLTVMLDRLDCGKPASHIEKKGPSVAALYDSTGAVSKAGAGFFKSIGLEPCSKEQLTRMPSLQIRDGYVFATITQPAVSTYSILQKALPELILSLDFPKSMRWARETLTWARPLQWFVALLGKTPVSFAVGTVLSGTQSRGHRILGKPFTVSMPENYVAELSQQHVLVSIEERRASIEQQLAAIEAKTGLKVVSPERVIHQVTELVEWPLLCVGQFDASFLKIPQEILISEMIEHQKYFPLASADGKLANQFVITANNTPSEMIVRGNEKVLSARLQDGVFLYEQDSKTTLKGFAERLSTITYMQGLGSMAAKSKRLQDLCTLLYGSIKVGSLETHRLVASLAKADLTTELVAEFPELQGIIGRHYALNMGLSQEVADSIDQHWNPRNEASELPQTPSAIIVALADKIDNILACFSMGLIPTSSKDPYALRRQVLATARILIAHKQHLSLSRVFEQGYDLLASSNKLPRTKSEVLADITAFFANRIRTIFEAHNFAHDEIEATLAAGFDDIYDSYLRIEALHEFRSKSTHFTGLLEVFKRTKGQLAAHPTATTDVNHALLFEEAEVNLFSSLRHQMPHFDRALAERNYEDAYKRLALLQEPLSELFAKVMIQCDDVRIKQNRLALLKNVQDRCLQLLDFSHIQVL